MPAVPRPSQPALTGTLPEALVDGAPPVRWEQAYVQVAMGRYADALVLLGRLVEQDDTAQASAAHRLRASVWRQLGLYGRAEADGRRALERAEDVGDPSARQELEAAAAAGHVADAVGRLQSGEDAADLELDERLARAKEALDAVLSDVPQRWRHTVRLRWVAGEVAITRGELETASHAFRRARAVAESAAAPRHVAKGTLFCAAVAAALGDGAAAEDLAADAAAIAERVGAGPLIWPALLIRAEVSTEREQAVALHQQAARILHGQLGALPSALRAEVVAVHPAAWLLREHVRGWGDPSP